MKIFGLYPLGGTNILARAGECTKEQPVPKDCNVCKRGKAFMRAIHEGNGECSHIDCPHRTRITAQPSR